MNCSKCLLDKDESCFYKKRRGCQELQSWCKVCLNTQTHKRQLENKKKAVELMGGKCIRCGYSKCLAALEFHHTNPENKEKIRTGRLASRCWDRYWIEISKCVLLCANCHREEENFMSA